MNTELYFPREGTSFPKTTEKEFDSKVRQLSEMDINIVYKTEIDLTKESFREALKETTSGDEKIELVMIADALDSDSQDRAQELLDELDISGKLKKISIADEEKKKEGSRKPRKEKQPEPAEIEVEVSGSLVIDEKEDPQLGEEDILTLDDEQEEDVSEEGSIELVGNKNGITAYSVEYRGMLIILLPSENFTGLDFGTILYRVSNSIIHPQKKNSFWRRFIPCSGDSPLDVIRKVILMLAICTFIVSSCMLVNILVIRPAINDNTTRSIRQLLVSGEEEKDEHGQEIKKKPTDGSEGTLVDFSNLVSQNKDTIGWIKVPNTQIDYVVVQPPANEDPEYYLYRDFYGNYDNYGTVFLDYRCKIDSKSMVLHGHHMQDGRMFANLKFFEDIDFYKKTPTFTFNTIYEKSDWKIISVFKTNTLDSQGDFFNYLRGDFDSDYDFLNFVYQIRERSLIDCPVTVNENDTIVSLSTCTYDFSEFRLVVVARKIRDGEDEKVDVSKAKLNPDTLYPDIWYNTYGGIKPDVTSFQEAYNNKQIDWYDGKIKTFTEKDDEELVKALNKSKKDAIKKLQEFVNTHKYAKKEKAQIEDLLDQYIKLINEAKGVGQVEQFQKNALEQFKEFKTENQVNSEMEESEKEASEQELSSKKSSAKVELHNSIAGNSYRRAQSDNIYEIFDTYNEKIDNAKSVDEVNEIKKEGIQKLSVVKTDDELKEEESKAAEESSKAAEEKKKQQQEEASREAEEKKRKQEEEEASKAAEESSKAAEEKKKQQEEATREAEEKKRKQEEEEASKAAEEQRRKEEEASKAAEEQRKKEEEEAASKAAEEQRKKEEEEAASKAAEEQSRKEQELQTARDNAIGEIDGYLDINNYYSDQQAEISAIISEYSQIINGSDDASYIQNTLVADAQAKLDQVKTIDQVEAETQPDEG